MSPAPSAARALFVVLDGVDGCGKSTQARRLALELGRMSGNEALHVREPGSTRVGEALRAILLSRDHAHMSPRVETLLFAAARAQTLAELVEPALRAGRHVVCERFHASTFAYQAVAGGLPEREVLDLLEHWAGQPRPDLEILLTLAPEEAARRRSAATDRIEDKGLDFQRRVAQGYARYKELVPRAIVIDGARSEDSVARDVLQEVQRALG
ncbi:MAG: dTMP kinase [Planctomycetes bacterium]|nr:dTMP kinase [Planctomycetota bacterium]